MNVELTNCNVPENPLTYIGKISGITTDRINKGDAEKRAVFCIKNEHLSILEHIILSWNVTDVSRVLTHQLVRHRMASYTQESQRYVKLKPGFDWFIVPPKIAENAESSEIFNKFMSDTEKCYDSLLSCGIKPEDARFILPNAASTKIYITMNLREFALFYKLRSDSHAQWEIQELAKLMKETLSELRDDQWNSLLELLM